MFATFPVKPRSPLVAPRSPLLVPKSPRDSKREHRVAHIYEPRSPTFFPNKPLPAHIPERPAPILSLPGLPPRELPRSVVKPPKKRFGHGLIENGKTWLAQFRLPWSPPDPTTPTIPPARPMSDEFVNEFGYQTPKQDKYLDDLESVKSDDVSEYRRDPPPLYTKDPPEGGLVGWMTVAAAFLIQFATIGYLFTWNVFEGKSSDHYHHVFLTDQNPIAVRFIGSVQWFLAFLLSLVAGKLADSGYFRYSVIAGSGLFAVSLFLLSIIPEEVFGGVFVCQALGMGIGIGLVFVPTAIVPLHYFKRQRGLAIGIVMSGGSFGGMIFPPVLRVLISQHGMSSAVRVTAAIITGFLVIANVLLIVKSPPKPEKSVYPVPRLDLAKYSKEMEYLFAAGGSFLTMLFIYYPVMYLDLLGREKGVDAKSAFNTVIILSLTGIIGRVGFGFASDIVGPWNLLIPVSGGLVLMLFTMCTIQGIKSLVVFSIFYGIFAGAWLSLMVTALSTLASRASETGTRVGLVLSVSSIGVLFSFLLQDGVLTPKVWAIPSAIAGVLFMGVTALAYLSRTMLAAKMSAKRRRIGLMYGVQIL
ncbi:major facilitator superfamily domain-containing protein [Flammula alnicola]|nr:major facilitator superfamily domain-containing protein [Flammula alnicola]